MYMTKYKLHIINILNENYVLFVKPDSSVEIDVYR